MATEAATQRSLNLPTTPPSILFPDKALQEKGKTMPPGYKASVGNLQTFELPKEITASPEDFKLGRAIVDAWRKDGIIQIKMDPSHAKTVRKAFEASRNFFSLSREEKAKCVDSQSFAGYIASGEEITNGVSDYSEIFTVTKDLPPSDPRVQAKWPCHGPCPWPNAGMRDTVKEYMDYLGSNGERLLALTALGLELPDPNALTNLASDGWHHLRILRFPKTGDENGAGTKGRGIGSHTDYGLLVIAAQDDVGGLFIRPPYPDEQFKNWEKSTAGMAENDDRWVYVPPEDGVFTVFPGDMMQLITNNHLPSTPHKVGMNSRERYAFAYFHEPNFCANIKSLDGAHDEQMHYGTHFTNMFMRNYPERITAKRMKEENRMDVLDKPELHRFN